jgi:glucose uptake protein GlcU
MGLPTFMRGENAATISSILGLVAVVLAVIGMVFTALF